MKNHPDMDCEEGARCSAVLKIQSEGQLAGPNWSNCRPRNILK